MGVQVQPVVGEWVARRWSLFLVVPQLAIALLFIVIPMFRGGSYYLGVAKSDPYGYGWLMLLASIPYGVGLLAIFRTGHSPSHRAIWAGFAVVAIPFVIAPLAQSHDAFQYVFYAKMQLAHHANPYLVAPSIFAEDPWFRFAGWPDAVSVYGPVWTHLVAGGVALTGQRLIAGLL